AEGFFDIMSVYYNINNKKMSNDTLYIANNGKGYKFTLTYLASMGILNADINIYSDLDVSINDYKNNILKNDILSHMNGINIYYNNVEGQKDFGTTMDNIKLSSKNIVRI